MDRGQLCTQEAELRRVKSAIAGRVLAFCAARLRDGGEFTAAELESYVRADGPAAPDSAGRILRELRRKGAVSYVVVTRTQSRYRVVAIRKSQKELFA